ncbi:ROK family transcriptional regulator [Microbacterium indicum]|uniref:ROK family transcriptional regulator n=1 Tax=Microbacterium indicum TaxID=358100 RepID=UPI0003FFB97D|nr:ROK family protein [Microbacterium indicum]
MSRPPVQIAGIDPRALRRVNTSVTLRALAVSTEPLTMSALAETTGLSRRTLELILDELVRAGWVDELPRRSTSGLAGRPARRFELRPQHALLAAVRFTTEDVTALVADVRGRVLARAQAPLRDYRDPGLCLDDAAVLVRAAVADSGATLDRLRAGAIASGGAIDDDGIVRRLVDTERWAGFDFPSEMAGRLDVPWFADNDANLGALAERWRGTAVDHETIVWAILGARTGVGTLIRGDIHRGFEGAAGELVEAWPLLAQVFHGHPVGSLTSPDPAARAAALETVARARDGDARALVLIDEFVEHIATMIVTLSWTVAPSLFVLGGGVEDAADVILPRLAEALREARAPDIPLRMSTLGPDAPLIGALRFALDRMDVELFGPVLTLDPAAPPGAGSPTHPIDDKDHA